MDSDRLGELRDYAWNYFSLHTDQRLRTFHFYVLLSTVIVGALLTVAKGSHDAIVSCPLAFGLAFVSFVFWKLDLRNKELVRYGEEALKSLEADSGEECANEAASPIAIFSREESVTAMRRRGFRAFVARPLSYSACFNLVFAAFGMSGLVAGVALLISGLAG